MTMVVPAQHANADAIGVHRDSARCAAAAPAGDGLQIDNVVTLP
jgi:hypothetical protein